MRIDPARCSIAGPRIGAAILATERMLRIEVVHSQYPSITTQWPHKKRTQKKQPKRSLTEQIWKSITRADVAGVVLILIAVFTLLSLMTGSRGSITGAWIDALESAFGIGAWAFPLLLGVFGLWLVIHAVDRMPDMSWQRPAGIAMLFVAFITGAGLMLSPSRSQRRRLARRADRRPTGGRHHRRRRLGAGHPAHHRRHCRPGRPFYRGWRTSVLGHVAGLALSTRRNQDAANSAGAPLPSGTIPLHKRMGENIGIFLSRFQRRPDTTPIYSAKRPAQEKQTQTEPPKSITIGGDATPASSSVAPAAQVSSIAEQFAAVAAYHRRHAGSAARMASSQHRRHARGLGSDRRQRQHDS